MPRNPNNPRKDLRPEVVAKKQRVMTEEAIKAGKKELKWADIDQEKLMALVDKSAGLLKPIAQYLGVSRETIYNWTKAHPEFKKAIDDARENTLDIIEGKMFKNAIDGNERAQEFLLRTIGKHRGYSEKTEIEANVDATVEEEIKLPSLTDEDIEKLKKINKLASNE